MFKKLRKNKIFWSGTFNSLLQKNRFFNIIIRDRWNCTSVFISSFISFVVNIYVQYFIDAVRNQTFNNKYLLELIKRKSKILVKIMLLKCALSFDHWKTFSENYKPIRVWYGLFTKLPSLFKIKEVQAF